MLIIYCLDKLFTELFPLNFVFVIMDVCPGHILESTKGIEMKLGIPRFQRFPCLSNVAH